MGSPMTIVIGTCQVRGGELIGHGEVPPAVEEKQRHAKRPRYLLHGRTSSKVKQLRVAKVVDRHQRSTTLERDLDKSLPLLQIHFLVFARREEDLGDAAGHEASRAL